MQNVHCNALLGMPHPIFYADLLHPAGSKMRFVEAG
jgi:hypothetical protein